MEATSLSWVKNLLFTCSMLTPDRIGTSVTCSCHESVRSPAWFNFKELSWNIKKNYGYATFRICERAIWAPICDSRAIRRLARRAKPALSCRRSDFSVPCVSPKSKCKSSNFEFNFSYQRIFKFIEKRTFCVTVPYFELVFPAQEIQV